MIGEPCEDFDPEAQDRSQARRHPISSQADALHTIKSYTQVIGVDVLTWLAL